MVPCILNRLEEAVWGEEAEDQHPCCTPLRMSEGWVTAALRSARVSERAGKAVLQRPCEQSTTIVTILSTEVASLMGRDG